MLPLASSRWRTLRLCAESRCLPDVLVTSGAEMFVWQLLAAEVMYDPGMGIQYQATTTFSAAGAGGGKP